jgi:hypothetical protein
MRNFAAAFAGLIGAAGAALAMRVFLGAHSSRVVVPGTTWPVETLTPALTGIAAVLGMMAAIALALRLGHAGDFRSARELAGRTLVLSALMIALAATGYGLRGEVLSHLGIGAAAPTVEFEIRVPLAVANRAPLEETQVEFRSDRRSALARLRREWRAAPDEQMVVSGRVAIDIGTLDRAIVLNLPGEPSRLFRLRLARNPSPSDEFGPWHQVDAFAKAGSGAPEGAKPVDGFAIRYRAL